MKQNNAGGADVSLRKFGMSCNYWLKMDSGIVHCSSILGGVSRSIQ